MDLIFPERRKIDHWSRLPNLNRKVGSKFEGQTSNGQMKGHVGNVCIKKCQESNININRMEDLTRLDHRSRISDRDRKGQTLKV